MTLTFRFIGSARGASGKGKFTLDFHSPMLLREALTILLRKYPRLDVALDRCPDNLEHNALVLVNGKEISVLKGLQTLLVDGDEVIFVSVIHGG